MSGHAPKGHHFIEISASPASLLKWLLLCVAGVLGGFAGVLSVLLAQFLLVMGGSESSDKHGISSYQASRLGGVVIVGFVLFSLIWHAKFSGYAIFTPRLGDILLISIAFFVLGLFEDLKGLLRANVRFVLMLAMLTSFLLFVPQFILVKTGVTWLDESLLTIPFLAFLFTTLGLVFFVNAFNTADGANGLISGISLFAVTGLCQIGVPGLTPLLVIAAIGCAIFMLFNIFVGRIFMGDGGAYFLGALVGFALVLVSSEQVVSPWYLLCLVFYPHADLLFSMVRRKYSGKPMFGADNGHLHNLLFARLSSITNSNRFANSLTGVIIAIMFSGLPLLLNNLVSSINWLYLYLVLWMAYFVVRAFCTAPITVQSELSCNS